ncbi:TolC family protein [Asaia bogorensis]|uniref:TolC family protein n=1 Tax=Asaia bogorensis TaxID=91915 RepID=UPI00285DF3CB|nr:TolC family protein [Asaia bogorensis]MDR6183469.1 outer membrane protein [Asaia bogorensis NBRC 16594]
MTPNLVSHRTLLLRGLPLLMLGAMLAGCNDTRDLAPQSADHAWHPHGATGLTLPPDIRNPSPDWPTGKGVGGASSSAGHAQRALPEGQDHVLSLPQLIDLAERNNPRTRIAWESARQAAIGVGMSRAAMLPQLTFSAMGGFQRMALPLPNYLSSRGYLTSNGAAAFPKLELDYLLLDFGRTRARINEAKFQTLAANFGFSAVHQQLILDVISAYHSQQAAQAIVAASHHAVDNMALLLRAAQSRHEHGEATIVDVATAERNLAQARFDLDKAVDAEHGAHHALLEVTGLPATLPLEIEPMPVQALPQSSPGQIRQLVDQALASRPDLLADIARLRASDEAIAESKAALMPRVAFAGTMSGYLGALKTYGTGRSAPASAIAQPEAGAFLQVSWPIYQGGLRANAIHMAQSQHDAAEATLLKDRLSVERQVADSQDALETALAQVKSARVLNDAARTANEGASQAYAHGVGTMTDASAAAAALFEAQASLAVSVAQAFTKAAALAHATGQLDLANNMPDEMNTAAPR